MEWDSFWPGRWVRYLVLSSLPVWFSSIAICSCGQGRVEKGKYSEVLKPFFLMMVLRKARGDFFSFFSEASNPKVCSFFFY